MVGHVTGRGESAKLSAFEQQSVGTGRRMADDSERNAESRRILDRVAREAGSDTASMLDSSARRAGDHIAAQDADHDDRIELWGTRIGRLLGLVITLGLFVWLISYLLRG